MNLLYIKWITAAQKLFRVRVKDQVVNLLRSRNHRDIFQGHKQFELFAAFSLFICVSTHACNVRVACPGKRIRIGCVDFSGALSTVLCGVFGGGSSFLVGWPTVGLGSVSDFRGLFAGAGGIFILGWSAGQQFYDVLRFS